MFICVSFCSGISIWATNDDKKRACSIHHEEYCDNFRQKFQPLMQSAPKISFCHFSQPLTYTRYLLQFFKLMGDHYTDHDQQSHVHKGKVYASHPWDFFIDLSPYSCCNMVNPLNAELNPICHLLALLGGATIVVVSRLRVNISAGDFPHAAIPVNYTSKFLLIIPTNFGNFLKLQHISFH